MIFFLLNLFALPLIKRIVPLANCKAILDLSGLGLKTYSFIKRLLCSVSLTVDSSRNVMAMRPAEVSTLSNEFMSKSNSAAKVSSLTTLPYPVNSVISPIESA